MIDENRLYELAGPKSFDRGVGYFHEGRVALTVSDKSGFQARAEGIASYRLWLRDDPDGLLWDCDCPVVADGGFCKHLVAAGLTWLDGAATGEEEYQKAGLDDEARALLWEDFFAHPNRQSWPRLRQAADELPMTINGRLYATKL